MNRAITLVSVRNEEIGRITRSRARVSDLHESSAQTVPSKPAITNSLTKRSKTKMSLVDWSDENSHPNTAMSMVISSKRKQPLKHITNVVPKNDTNNGSECSRTSLAKLNPVKKSKLSSLGEVVYHGIPATRGVSSKKETALKDFTDGVLRNVTNICHGDGSFKDCCIVATAQEPKKLPGIKDASSKSNLATVKEMVEVNQKHKINEECSGQKHTENAHKMEIDGSDHLESKTKSDIVDIDSNHTNPQLCSLYAADIYDNLRANELDQRPYSNYMETMQHDINQSMRAILIDWLVEVAAEHKHVPDTLHLSVHILDQFLSKKAIYREKLQLLGITCMFIASKYEELCAPRVERFCVVTANTYSTEDVRGMEKQILKSLGFRLSVPTTKTFLRRFLHAAQSSSDVPSLQLEYMANYLVELTLLEYDFLRFIPSIIAASAVFLARWTLDQSVHPWNKTLEHYTCYRSSDLKDTVSMLHCLHKNNQNFPLRAIYDKYRHLKFLCVANLPSQNLLPTLFS